MFHEGLLLIRDAIANACVRPMPFPASDEDNAFAVTADQIVGVEGAGKSGFTSCLSPRRPAQRCRSNGSYRAP